VVFTFWKTYVLTKLCDVMLYRLLERYQHFGGNLLPLASVLNMEVAGSSETLVPFYQVSWHHNPEDPHIHCSKNLKSHISLCFRYLECFLRVLTFLEGIFSISYTLYVLSLLYFRFSSNQLNPLSHTDWTFVLLLVSFLHFSWSVFITSSRNSCMWQVQNTRWWGRAFSAWECCYNIL
jgi:hypothetical protein